MIAQNQTFNDITVYIDGGTYTGCTFTRCILVVSGILPAQIAGNKFIECKWEFAGPAANTMVFLTSLYAGGASDFVEKIFDAIRKNTGGLKPGDRIVLN
jgi:hypothetical protein